MERFVDQITIEIASGSGGHGAVSFRREKYIPRGGPDGGDGGRGGDVIFRVRENLKTLTHLTMRHHYHAENGRPGSKANRHGADGSPAIVEVPPGTMITNLDTGEVIDDFTETGRERVVLQGGRGGKGNAHFATARHQTPRFAQPGEPGEKFRIKVELRIIADMGLVGLPNAGKSSLLDVLTNASPKIGAYPFTTKIPNLGVLQVGYTDIVIADIPGIIEGASGGHGLGLRFLRHIARTRGLIFLIDITEPDPYGVFRMLLDELSSYSRDLAELPRIIVANKTDLDPDGEFLASFKQDFADASDGSAVRERIFAMSNFSRQGLDELIRAIRDLYAGQVQIEGANQKMKDAVPDFMQNPAPDYIPENAGVGRDNESAASQGAEPSDA